MASDFEEMIRKVESFVDGLGIDLKPIMFINAVKGVSEGMKIQEAIYYGILSGYTGRITDLTGQPREQVDQVVNAMARIMG